MSDLPKTMRAWYYDALGTPRKVLKLKNDFPAPTISKGNSLLVRVSHCALNPVGAVTMATVPSFMRKCPAVPEIDFSGIVIAAGPSAPSNFPVGTKISGTYTVATSRSGIGALAEYVEISEETAGFAKAPEGLGMAGVAGLQCAGQTAVAMCEAAGVKKGDRVLVNGASGGVGTMVVQVAKAMGAAEVVAVCSERNADLVKSLGADEVIDYRTYDPLTDYLKDKYSTRPFDAILDTVGVQALYKKSPDYLKEDSVHVNVGINDGLKSFVRWGMNAALPQALGGVPRKYTMFNTVLDMRMAGVVVKLAEEKKLKTVVDKVYEMEDTLEAYDLLLSQRARGKVIIHVQDV